MLASVIPLSRRRRARAHQKQQQPCPPAAALPRLSARARVWLMCPCTWVRCCLVFRATQVQPRGQGGHELGRVVEHGLQRAQAKVVKDALATFTESEIIVSGSTRVTGEPYILSTVRAYIKVARQWRGSRWRMAAP